MATVVGLLGVGVVDLLVIARCKRQGTMRDATLWVLVYVGLAALFAGGLAVFAGARRRASSSPAT